MAKREYSCACFWTGFSMMVQFVVYLVILFNTRESLLSPQRVERANDWAHNPMWKREQCTVLAAGMSNRGACDADSEYYTECPGYAHCSEEHSQCKCDGDVIFAPGLYGDTWIPDMSKAAKLESNQGHVTCNEHSFGKDPAPGTWKACWCLKKKIVDYVRAGGSVHARKCGAKANHEYWRTVGYSSKTTSSLAITEGDTRKDEYTTKDEDLEEQEIAIEADENTSYLLEVPDYYNSRRRGGCRQVLLPWALVKVKSSGIFEEAGVERLRCAYQFGANAVSRENTEDIANERVKDFKRYLDSETDCYTMGDCVVGMTAPSVLSQHELANGNRFKSTALTLLGVHVLIMTLLGVIGGMYEIKGFTPLDFGIWACMEGCIEFIAGLVQFFDGTPGNFGPTAGTILLGVLWAALIAYFLPARIYYALHKDPTNRSQVVRQASFPTLAILRRANSLRDVVAGPRPLRMGDRVFLIAAEQGLGANEEGYVAGIDGEQAVFQSDAGDIVRVATSNLRVIA